MNATKKEYPMLLVENTIWKVELIKKDEIMIQLDRLASMYIVLFENQYVYYGESFKLPKYINKIIAKHLVINK